MERYAGKALGGGLAVGELYFYAKDERQVKRRKVEDTDAELGRYEAAKAEAKEALRRLHGRALQEVGEVNAEIFEVHAMLLEDDDFNESVRHIITGQQVNAEYAVAAAGDNFAQMFEGMEDEYFRARAVDIRDVSERLVKALAGEHQETDIPPGPAIVMADALTPSETVQMNKANLLGFVTRTGSASSHTAILARSMGIPAISGVAVSREWAGKEAVLDASAGELILEPDEARRADAQEALKREKEKRRLLEQYKGKETVTADGKKILLYANAGSVSDVAVALENDAEGIGLFRSEFLYLESDHAPSEEEQFQAYRSVAESMAGRRVIIRTMDIGADKQAEYLGLEKEENPAMGYRAIRICLDRRELFKEQLRAILRAGAYGRVAVMYPMVISVDEVRQAKAIAAEARAELTAAGIACGEVEQGIMIETPAAALISDELAAEVDFFSLGTNDLVQYTLALDRQNERLDKWYDPAHPAVMRLIQTVIENGHAGGCWVGICGELAGDPQMAVRLVQMGIDELSVTPGQVLPLRRAIVESKWK